MVRDAGKEHRRQNPMAMTASPGIERTFDGIDARFLMRTARSSRNPALYERNGMRVANMKISRKLIAGFLVIMLAVVDLSGVVQFNIWKLEEATLAQEESAKTMRIAAQLEPALLEQIVALRGYLLHQAPARLEQIEVERTNFQNSLQQLDAVVTDRGQKQRLAEIREKGTTLMAGQDKRVAMARNPLTLGQAIADFSEGKGKNLQLFRDAMEAFHDAEGQRQADRSAEQYSAKSSMQLALLIGSIAAASLAVLVGWLLSRAIATPIDRMTALMDRLAKGDKSIVVEGQDRKDEIGAMAVAVESFKQAAIERERLESEAAAARIDQEQAKTRQAALDNAKAEDLRVFVGVVEVGFERLSAG
ncbi:CHASE3 domain-containing protein, partial [Aurantimonas sp. C2-3-R2]|uniref:CHASE3 domain-containing protein n=4 Tax=unclassified Aurantimonas TaxID=2638230 RepID=UPI002E176171